MQGEAPQGGPAGDVPAHAGRGAARHRVVLAGRRRRRRAALLRDHRQAAVRLAVRSRGGGAHRPPAQPRREPVRRLPGAGRDAHAEAGAGPADPLRRPTAASWPCSTAAWSSAPYGRRFLESLPPARLVHDLAEVEGRLIRRMSVVPPSPGTDRRPSRPPPWPPVGMARRCPARPDRAVSLAGTGSTASGTTAWARPTSTTGVGHRARTHGLGPHAGTREPFAWFRRTVELGPDGLGPTPAGGPAALGLTMGKVDSAYEVFAGGCASAAWAGCPRTRASNTTGTAPSGPAVRRRAERAARARGAGVEARRHQPERPRARRGPFLLGPIAALTRRELLPSCRS